MLEQLLSELRKNQRLRFGVWLILGIVLSYGFLLLDEQRLLIQTEHQRLAEQLAQLKAITGQEIWFERVTQADEQKQLLMSKLWFAETAGLAQANFQTWLTDQSDKLGIKRTRLLVESATPKLANLQILAVSAQLEGTFVPEQLIPLFYAVETFSTWIVIERFEVKGLYRRVSFSLLLTAYFKLANT